MIKFLKHHNVLFISIRRYISTHIFQGHFIFILVGEGRRRKNELCISPRRLLTSSGNLAVLSIVDCVSNSSQWKFKQVWHLSKNKMALAFAPLPRLCERVEHSRGHLRQKISK
uniref:Uncharacterized protein n=1 Tax=Steinernema glaseri TaxID=37863 RepID=A0A1I7YFI2_9BILA